MDDYSRKVVKLLLERDRPYLSRLVGIQIQEDATIDAVCEAIAVQAESTKNVHKSSIFVCGKCNSKEITVREVQTRSADEGSTIIHICSKCGHQW